MHNRQIPKEDLVILQAILEEAAQELKTIGEEEQRSMHLRRVSGAPLPNESASGDFELRRKEALEQCAERIRARMSAPGWEAFEKALDKRASMIEALHQSFIEVPYPEASAAQLGSGDTFTSESLVRGMAPAGHCILDGHNETSGRRGLPAPHHSARQFSTELVPE